MHQSGDMIRPSPVVENAPPIEYYGASWNGVSIHTIHYSVLSKYNFTYHQTYKIEITQLDFFCLNYTYILLIYHYYLLLSEPNQTTNITF